VVVNTAEKQRKDRDSYCELLTVVYTIGLVSLWYVENMEEDVLYKRVIDNISAYMGFEPGTTAPHNQMGTSELMMDG
jgi:hypothetical protein